MTDATFIALCIAAFIAAFIAGPFIRGFVGAWYRTRQLRRIERFAFVKTVDLDDHREDTNDDST